MFRRTAIAFCKYIATGSFLTVKYAVIYAMIAVVLLAHGVAHAQNSHPLVLGSGDLTWRITSMDFGWEDQAVHDFLESTKDSQVNEFTRSTDMSRSRTIKLYGEGEIDLGPRLDSQGPLSLNIFKTLQSNAIFQVHAEVSAKAGCAASCEFNWREQHQKCARELNNVMKKIDKQVRISNPFLEFTVLFINSGEQHYNCIDLRIPIMIGQQVVTYALCHESQSTSDFEIPAIRPRGIPVRFRASLDNSSAMRLLEGMQDKAPTIRIENSRGRIIAKETGEDLISKIQETAGNSCSVSILVPYAPPLTWRIAKRSAHGKTNLLSALDAINAVVKESLGTDKPLFAINGGILDSVAGVDNAMGSLSAGTKLWWKMSVNGQDQPFELARYLDDDIVFSLSKGMPSFSAKYVGLIQASGNRGHAFHQYTLARCFAEGNGIRKDEVAAFTWYCKAADQGLAKAQFNLGRCYYYGLGVAKDELEAFMWFLKAAYHGDAEAQTALGKCYQNGIGTAKDAREAVMWFHKAAYQGDAEAQRALGLCYLNREGVAQSAREAVMWLHKAAYHGDAEAQSALGLCYWQGRGVAEDARETVKWFRLAADQGYAGAQLNLGMCYSNGYGVAEDSQEAAKWYRLAAEQGVALAQAFLGIFYMKGEGVAQDAREAVKWFRKAAEQGFADAQFNLGKCYQDGEGVAQDKQEAVKWFRLASEQGHYGAQYLLGQCYEKGNGVSKDKQEAVKWYRKAAERGHDDAIKALKSLE